MRIPRLCGRGRANQRNADDTALWFPRTAFHGSNPPKHDFGEGGRIHQYAFRTTLDLAEVSGDSLQPRRMLMIVA